MKKINKMKIRVNGKVKSISNKYSMLDLVKILKIPLKSVYCSSTSFKSSKLLENHCTVVRNH